MNFDIQVSKSSYFSFSIIAYRFFEKWVPILLHDYLECERNNLVNMKKQTAPTKFFSEHAPSNNYQISNSVATVPCKSNTAKIALKILLDHWIIKFGPLISLVTDRGSEYTNNDMYFVL